MRKIAVITGTRAEYGLLYWVIRKIADDPTLTLQLVVTGMHLSPEFGLTYKEIEKDGFSITSKVEMLLSSDTVVGITKSIGVGVASFADTFSILQPDLVLVLGDRFEILSAVTAAMIARIPVAHCHGGEATEGLIDESIRHSITKMSHLHFTATDEYRQRVIQLGEQPDRVFNVGALGIENINKMQLLSRDEFETAIDFKIGNLSALITFHPVTLENATAGEQFSQLLSALQERPEVSIIFTKPNADTEGRVIIKMIDDFVKNNPDRSCAFISLGQMRYLSALRHVNVVIGNSSSGLVEVPSFGIPTINIGDRQRGRIQAQSVISCLPNHTSISEALEKALSPACVSFCKTVINPYGVENASDKIVPVLRNVELDGILKKSFFDIKWEK